MRDFTVMRFEADMILSFISAYKVLDIILIFLGILTFIKLISLICTYKKYKKSLKQEEFDIEVEEKIDEISDKRSISSPVEAIDTKENKPSEEVSLADILDNILACKEA